MVALTWTPKLGFTDYHKLREKSQQLTDCKAFEPAVPRLANEDKMMTHFRCISRQTAGPRY